MTGQDDNIRPVGYNEDVHQPFDVQAQRGDYAMWKLLGALAFLIILALIIFFVYQPGARDRDDPVVISPSKTALKIPPAKSEPEPINDKAIYGAGQTATTTPPPTTVEPEAPIKLPDAVKIVETPAPSQPVITRPTQSKPSRPITAQTPQPAPSPQGTSGKHLVQVASLRSYEEAEAAWNKITAKFPFLRGQLYDIKRVDLNKKGIYYRLRIDGLSSPASANAVCQKLQANGQACFNTSR